MSSAWLSWSTVFPSFSVQSKPYSSFWFSFVMELVFCFRASQKEENAEGVHVEYMLLVHVKALIRFLSSPYIRFIGVNVDVTLINESKHADCVTCCESVQWM